MDTIFTPAGIADRCPMLSERGFRGGFWEDNREPFYPKVKWALGSDGSQAFGCPASYTFDLHRPDGSVVRVSREHSLVRVPQEELDFRRSMPMVPQAGETLPAYVRLILPGDGRIWVWTTQPNVKTALSPESAEQFGITHTWLHPAHGTFDVFDQDGNWLAAVRLPSRARYSGWPTEANVVIRGDTLWAVEEDEFEVNTVVRYTVPGLRRPLEFG